MAIEISLKDRLGQNIESLTGILRDLGDKELVLERPTPNSSSSYLLTIAPYSLIGRCSYPIQSRDE